MKQLLLLAALAFVGFTFAPGLTAAGETATTGNGTAAATPTAEAIAAKKAAVEAAQSFVNDYDSVVKRVRGKLTPRVNWLREQDARIRGIFPTLDAVAETHPDLALTASGVIRLYAAGLRDAPNAEFRAASFATEKRITNTVFTRALATGRYDASYRAWFGKHLGTLAADTAITALKAEARALVAVAQTPERDTFLQEVLTQLAVFQKLQ